ncbi:hypothetical protein CHU95_04895 [Niveispirillum lacus]|uniref:Uncharacterized protein n=1 Tax=Niveispirillum lacus TaxID=1981099 RepID=A0A255Z546_9PROT|nr:hypothetical protein CHU95_04895 [Niveispirillum lacus]
MLLLQLRWRSRSAQQLWQILLRLLGHWLSLLKESPLARAPVRLLRRGQLARQRLESWQALRMI